MVAIAKEGGGSVSTRTRTNESYMNALYYRFSSFFVDNLANLKDIMEQLVEVPDEEEKIKEELFLLLSYFILTFEHRVDKIKTVIFRNR